MLVLILAGVKSGATGRLRYAFSFLRDIQYSAFQYNRIPGRAAKNVSIPVAQHLAVAAFPHKRIRSSTDFAFPWIIVFNNFRINTPIRSR